MNYISVIFQVDVLFLNDVAVNTKEKQKLKFGDELSVIRTIEEVGPSTLAANQTRIHNSRIVLEFKVSKILSYINLEEVYIFDDMTLLTKVPHIFTLGKRIVVRIRCSYRKALSKTDKA